jgi:chromosome segregation ATPase
MSTEPVVENPPLSDARASMMEETKAQMAALSISLETSQSVLAFVRNLLEQSQEQEKSLRDTVAQMKAKEEAGDKSVQERDQTIADLRNKLLATQERAFLLDKQLEFAIRDRDSRLMEMKTKLDEARGQSEGGSKRLEELQAALQAAESRCAELEGKVEDMRSQIDTTQKIIVDMQSKLEETKARAEQAEQRASEAEASVQSFGADSQAREEELTMQV